ncbi:SirB1 family protein [Gallibacterium anatis]|uniref:SirB1 family protein n=1 Tax=Gallibacterium anatis TaxID=750 RepID=UPI00057DF2F6|nr:SirB1 family protein [Gallibacterium anatis]
MEKNRIIENDEALRIALEREKAGKYLLNQLISFNQIIDADFKKSSIYSRLGHLIREFGKFIEGETDVKMRVHLLLQFFYGEKGFFCDRETYFHASNLMLPHVFATKEGTPAVLGSILLFIAANFHLPIRGVNFPTQFLLRVDVDDEVAFIDPWNGKYVSQETIQTWLEGYLGFGTPLSEEYVGVGDLIDLEDRMYQVLKSALIREGRNEQALALIEHRLSETPDDPYEIRDRGVVYGNMECFHLAVPDLTYFVEQCPQDPVAPLIRLQLQDLKHIPYSFQ